MGKSNFPVSMMRECKPDKIWKLVNKLLTLFNMIKCNSNVPFYYVRVRQINH